MEHICIFVSGHSTHQKGTFYTPKADILEHEKEHSVRQSGHKKQLHLNLTA